MVEIRPARGDDVDDVVSFTRTTWPDREAGDYLPDVFPQWVQDDDPDRRTLVADVEGEAVGVLQTVLLSPYEAWQQGMRVHPDYRGEGIGHSLARAGFEWARERGATVARNMVFSWNEMGLGLSRATGFDPVTEFRRANPDPASRDPAADIATDPNAAWRFWVDSATRDHLRGLAFDPAESWALSYLTRERLVRAADEGALLVVQENGTRGFAYRNRVAERESEDGTERWAEYGAAAWADAGACEAVFDAIVDDAASVDADRTRVLIPETVGAVSDVALADIDFSAEPDFVLAADLTGV